MLLFMRGLDDGQLRIALREGADQARRVSRAAPQGASPAGDPRLAQRLEQQGTPKDVALEEAKKSTFGFEPGDIVTEVMSFGSSTPIAVQVIGTDLSVIRQHATKIAREMKRIPYLRDVQFAQTLDYLTVEIDIDREGGASAASPSRTSARR